MTPYEQARQIVTAAMGERPQPKSVSDFTYSTTRAQAHEAFAQMETEFLGAAAWDREVRRVKCEIEAGATAIQVRLAA